MSIVAGWRDQGMRLRSIVLVVAALALAGCASNATTPDTLVPANMKELKAALGVGPVDPVYDAPLAKAQANASTVTAGAPVRFTSEGSSDPQGLPLAYAWTFGDGATAQGSMAEHAYGAAGEYVARLTVANDKGLRDAAVVTVRVLDANRAPVAVLRIVDDAGEPVKSVERGVRVVFDATSSTDDGPFVVDWDFGDSTTSHEAKVGHTYAAPGRYLARLHVVDKDGLTSTAEALVRVNALYETDGAFALTDEPTATYAFPVASGLAGLDLTLAFEGALGANDLTLVLKDAGGKEVARAKGPTPTAAQGEQTRALTLDADALAGHAPGDWTVQVVREAGSPTGVAWSLVLRETY